MKWSIDGIEALASVADTGSFSAAGAKLGKVPSAVSYQISTLEEALGVSLFDRSGHRAQLTAAGVAVLDEGRFLLARAVRIQRLAARFSLGWEERLRVVVDGAVPTGPILQALSSLGGEGIPTHAQLRTEFLGGVPARFSELKADLMLTLVVPSDPLLQVVELPSVEFVLVLSPDHPAAGGVADLQTLQGHIELSVHDSDVSTADKGTNLIAGARVFYVGDFSAKKEGLLRGLGLGWMPLHSVKAELEAGELVELDYGPGSRRRFPLALASRLDRPLGPAGEQFLGLLVEVFGG